MKIGMTDADGFDKHAKDFEMLVVLISREEIESGNVGGTVDQLMRLTDSREHVLRFESRMHLSFSGYDEDPRGLRSIPDVVRYFRDVHRQWPYWVHFLNKQPDLYRLLMQLLTDAEEVRLPDGRKAWSVTPRAMQDAMLNLLRATHALYHAHMLTVEQYERMKAQFIEMVERASEPG